MEFVITGIAILSFLLFTVPVYWKNVAATFLIVLNAILSSVGAIGVMWTSQTLRIPLTESGMLKPILTIDLLSAMFILVINFTFITGIIYAQGYLKPYRNTKSATMLSVHYLSLVWLQFSMLLLCMFRDGFSFLLAWELMSVSSFFLVMFDAEHRNVFRVAINYLIQMHIGLLFILSGFLLVEHYTGIIGFDGLPIYFSQHNNILVFILLFSGFALKAGFVPFHTWLPEAHPAAPSHVSGIMSGVMIKMGIYGILRVTFSLQSQMLECGIFLMSIALLTGLYGVMQALLQRDLKKLLAYSSIENIGIIGIGIGSGLLGLHFRNQLLVVLGFTGALMHIINHSLFKSLLFFGAGAVYKATHTRNIEELGGLIKKMPRTSIVFLVGALAICGLPPFNGFVSEFLIYCGLFTGLQSQLPFVTALFIGAIVALALIGGLAVFTFTKAFGITFLGASRSKDVEHITETEASMLVPMSLICILILIIGVFPLLFVQPLMNLVYSLCPSKASLIYLNNFTQGIFMLSLVLGLLVLLIAALLWFRYWLLAKRSVQIKPTWGCGYTAPTPAIQYTATSYVGDFTKIVKPVIKTKYSYEAIAETDIFPTSRGFSSGSDDVVKTQLTDAPVDASLGLLRRWAVLQSGHIQHYVLYALVFMILIFVLSIFNII